MMTQWGTLTGDVVEVFFSMYANREVTDKVGPARRSARRVPIPWAAARSATAISLSLTMKSQPKTVIITGASQGIGAGVVRAFLARGYNVVGTALKRRNRTSFHLLIISL